MYGQDCTLQLICGKLLCAVNLIDSVRLLQPMQRVSGKSRVLPVGGMHSIPQQIKHGKCRERGWRAAGMRLTPPIEVALVAPVPSANPMAAAC